jgi:hypothetical protein
MPAYYKLIGYRGDTAYAIDPIEDDLGPLCQHIPAALQEFPVRWDGSIYFAIETAKEICRNAVAPDGMRFDKIEVLHRHSGDLVAWTNGQNTWKLKPM